MAKNYRTHVSGKHLCRQLRTTPMKANPHELLGAYVLDALDELERARFRVHLSTCGQCQAEIGGLQASAKRLDEINP